MDDQILFKLRCWEFKKYKVKITPRHDQELNVKSKLMEVFKERDILTEDEYFWDLIEFALYCWTFCREIDALLFIVTFWAQTVLLDDVVYKNDEGFVQNKSIQKYQPFIFRSLNLNYLKT